MESGSNSDVGKLRRSSGSGPKRMGMQGGGNKYADSDEDLDSNKNMGSDDDKSYGGHSNNSQNKMMN